MRPYVAVVGAGEASEQEARAAEAVGRGLAEGGAVVVCGGLGGVMAAACRGAKSAGGHTVGILPGLRRSDANPDVDFALATGLGEMRNALVVRAADAVIAIGGEFGTLSEIALALKAGKQVFGLGSWDLPSRAAAGGSVAPAASPDDAVRRALEACLAL